MPRRMHPSSLHAQYLGIKAVQWVASKPVTNLDGSSSPSHLACEARHGDLNLPLNVAGCELVVETWDMCRFNETMALYTEMQQRGLRPDSYTLTALLTGCERVNKWDQASRLFDDLTAAGVQPDVRNYNSLIYTLGKGGQWAQVCSEPCLLIVTRPCAQESGDCESLFRPL